MSDPRVPFPKFGAGIGLHRVSAIARALGLDLAGFGECGCVITGSNGKGSAAAMTAAILSQSGARVGRFTSPHLFSIRERFAIDGEDISAADLAAHWSRVLDAAQAYETPYPGDTVGGFEFLFLVAVSYFNEQRCDHTVWEAGIGGRYDPTRLIQAHAGALVSLDLEHTALLGETLEEIAYDKLDAFPESARVFLGANTAPLAPRLSAYAQVRGLAVTRADPDTLTFTPPLAGAHQRNNTEIAVRLAQTLRPALTETEIAAGLARTSWPGRLEILSRDPLIVIDVGHTPDAIAAARAGFEAMCAPDVLVCGASSDKPAEAIIAALAPGFARIICATAAHKGRPAAEIAGYARAAAPGAQITQAASVREAHALARAASGAVYVAGGLFLAAEFRAVHLGLDPAGLHFF